MAGPEVINRPVEIPAGSVVLEGELVVPAGVSGIVMFAHGSGSSRHSPRNKFVAGVIRDANLGTLLFDLLTHEEESVDTYTRHLRFDIGLLAGRLVAAANWLKSLEETKHLKIGIFGSSTGGAAALIAASLLGESVGTVVSRGGRPDLTGDELTRVKSPVLLIVGGLDYEVVKLNEQAYAKLECVKQMKIVPGASHLFEEPGKLNVVAELAAEWFGRYLN